MLYIITFTNVKKRLSKYFIRIYQHVMIPFSITMKTVLLMRKSNRSLPFKRSLRNFDKELEEAKIYFYIYEDTKNIGTQLNISLGMYQYFYEFIVEGTFSVPSINLYFFQTKVCIPSIPSQTNGCSQKGINQISESFPAYIVWQFPYNQSHNPNVQTQVHLQNFYHKNNKQILPLQTNSILYTNNIPHFRREKPTTNYKLLHFPHKLCARPERDSLIHT